MQKAWRDTVWKMFDVTVKTKPIFIICEFCNTQITNYWFINSISYSSVQSDQKVELVVFTKASKTTDFRMFLSKSSVCGKPLFWPLELSDLAEIQANELNMYWLQVLQFWWKYLYFWLFGTVLLGSKVFWITRYFVNVNSLLPVVAAILNFHTWTVPWPEVRPQRYY